MILPIALAIGFVTQGPDVPAPVYRIINVEADAFLIPKPELLRLARVQAELGLSADQKARLQALYRQLDEIRPAVANRTNDPARGRAEMLRRRAEIESSMADLLKPAQKTRLDQLHRQVQGLTTSTFDDLSTRLKLPETKLKQVRAIVDDGVKSLAKAATIPATLKTGAAPKTFKEVGELVQSKEFIASKEKALAEVFEIRRTIQKQVEQALTDRQRTAYRALLGKPFDVESLWTEEWPRHAEPDGEAVEVATQLGFDSGQRSDPDFDPKVIKPAYVGDRHPSVLFDEAHANYHTSQGRYKVFADLITNDGYKVTPNRDRFTAPKLAGSEILIIVNALVKPGLLPTKSSFTDDECDAVRDWVEAGGSLLLITDHPPFGAGSEALAMRFGVEMSQAETFDPANTVDKAILFSREKNILGDHAITRGRDPSEKVDRVLTFGGQSLKGPEGSVPILKFADSSFDFLDGRRTPAGGRSQGIAFQRGKGRVVVMGEAGQLSAQVYGLPPTPMGMNVPGSDNRKMALNLMHWLSKLID